MGETCRNDSLNSPRLTHQRTAASSELNSRTSHHNYTPAMCVVPGFYRAPDLSKHFQMIS